MLRIPTFGLTPCLIGLILFASGCATTKPTEIAASLEEDTLQFEPIPFFDLREEDLDPEVEPRAPSELLDAAYEALRAANLAQERGEDTEAYNQYTLMMELLIESDLDPTVFYTLRNEFGRILGTSTKLAKHYERTQPDAWTEEVIDLAFRSELEYPNPLNDRVLAEIKAIQTSYPKDFQRGLDRSNKYLPYIREEFKKAGLPADLVWLAMVESQYTPRIISHAGAGGMWQFMRSTGRRYDLSSDYYVDERYDWKKSTQAAISYLTELYEIFDGSWPLAVSAYNMGEGGLERAIAANGGDRNLWSLIETPPAANRIRRETKKFYPKLLASAIVAQDPEAYGFHNNGGIEEQTTHTTVSGIYSIRQIEKEAGLREGTLKNLNPQLIRGYTPPGRTAQIYVPLDTRTKVAAAIETMPEMRPGTHTVQRGETLSGIASLYRVSARELQDFNNIRSAKRLQIGQRLVVPGNENMSAPTVAASEANGRLVYTVRRGDSLSAIADRYRVSVSDLQAWNSLGRRTRIHVSDRMYVSAGKSTTVDTPMGEAIVYTVRAGDYPAKIAKNHNVRLNDFLAWNRLTTRSTIRIGERLKVYGVTAPRSTYAPAERSISEGTKGTHVVRSGENPTIIAKYHGVRTQQLLAWNGLSTRSVLQVGDVLYLHDPNQGPPVPKQLERVAKATPVPTAPARVVHKVSRGQNPTTIARRYGVPVNDLFKWNEWKKNHILHIGDEVIVIRQASND